MYLHGSYVEDILPKGPYPPWRIEPFWQDTLDVFYYLLAINISVEAFLMGVTVSLINHDNPHIWECSQGGSG